MNKRPVVIDCDPGVDDTLALCLAASRPELEIRAINPVAGNVGTRAPPQNALAPGRPDRRGLPRGPGR